MRRTAILLLCSSCGHTPAARPPRAWEPVDLPSIRDANDVDLALDEHAAIPVGHPRRAESRATLRAWLVADIDAQLRSGHIEPAFARFSAALRLYTAEELASAPTDPALLQAAERVRVAFARRGAEPEVLTALAAQLSFSPRDPQAPRRYAELCHWLEHVEPAQGPLALGGQIVEAHERAARSLPSPFLRDRLDELYRGLHASLARLPQTGLPTHLQEIVDATRPALRLAAAHLRTGTVQSALAALRTLRRTGAVAEEELRLRLEAAAGKHARAAEFLALAEALARQDAEAARRTCAAGVAALGDDPDLLACQANLAVREERFAVALHTARAAVVRRPDSPALRQLVFRLLLERLGRLVEHERLAAAAHVVASAEAFLAESRRVTPDLLLQPSLGAFLSVLAGGYFNAGEVDAAEKLLERALEHDPPADVFEDLGVIRWRRARHDEALALYGRAADIRLQSEESALRLAARLRDRMGDAHRDKGDVATARTMWIDAVGLWDRYIEKGSQSLGDDRPNWVAMAEVERAKALIALGESDAAIEAIRQAIDLAPQRGPTYVRAVAMLSSEGRLAAATEACHRGLVQVSVTDYFKVYCALWVYDLARRSGGAPDALARQYLETVEGDLWHHRLARFMVGRLPYADLERLADTRGKRAELYFYEAQNRLAAGQVDEARRLWEKVVATDMMAFFEYDMALRGLAAHSGAPAQQQPARGSHP